MTTALLDRSVAGHAVPVVGWEAGDDQWHYMRRGGITGSAVTAVLGFSGYDTPWEVWADKTGVREMPDRPGVAAALGTSLEPWLLAQASAILGADVVKAPARTYAHPAEPWRMYSPDGFVVDGRLFEAKTAGLASYRTPTGWADDAVPLGYEFQVRWGLHVHDLDVAEVVALVAGMGLIRRTIQRDLAIEAELVRQVSGWWHTHVVGNVEPPLGSGDNAVITSRYPTGRTGAEIELTGTDAIDLWDAYRAARERESDARADKEAAGAGIKALLGVHEIGRVGDHVLATWTPRKGAVDWERMARDLAEQGDLTLPDPETYRKPASRGLSVKD